MSNYNTLISAIQSYIKQNGNNEITGQILQSQLISMISELGFGYQYRGIAFPSTSPGTPDARVFYVAYTPGVYTNFNGLTVTGFCILKYDTTWRRDDIPIGGGGADFSVEPDDLTLETVGQTRLLKFANMEYDTTTPNGYGYKILRTGDVLATEMAGLVNTVFSIRYDFDLNGGTLTLPENSILRFDGGSIKNGSITGTRIGIEYYSEYKIFDNITFNGTFILPGPISPLLFGARLNDDSIDASPFLAKAIELASLSNVGIIIPRGNLYVKNSISVAGLSRLTIEGYGRASVLNVYNDFLVSDNSTEVNARFTNFALVKVQGQGSGYYKGIAFKDFYFTSSVMHGLAVRYFGIFIKGSIHVNTVIENSFFNGLGYSLLSGIYCEDFDNNNLYNATVAMDSCIRCNYINCAVRGSATNPLPNNRSLIYGDFTTSRFESNFCDYWKAVFDFYSYDSAGRFKGNSIVNNFFDRIFSLFIHRLNTNDVIIANNTFYECRKSDNTTGVWANTVDPDVINSTGWIMIRAASVYSLELFGNNISTDIFISTSPNSATTFNDKFIIKDVPANKKLFSYLTVNIASFDKTRDDFYFFNKKIYRTDFLFSLSATQFRREYVQDKALYRFGDGYYDFERNIPLLGQYTFEDVQRNSSFVGIAAESSTTTWVKKTIGGVDRLIATTSGGIIYALSSADIWDIIAAATTEGLSFAQTVRLYDRFVNVSQITGTPRCYSAYCSQTSFGAVNLKVSSLPTTSLFINRLVFLTTDSKWYRYTYNGWEEDTGLVPIKSVGTTEQRPQTYWRKIGTKYFDTDLNAFIIWDGDKWVFEDGGLSAGRKSGTTVQRPTLTVDDSGFQYFDNTLLKPIWWNGTGWIDATGATV